MSSKAKEVLSFLLPILPIGVSFNIRGQVDMVGEDLLCKETPDQGVFMLHLLFLSSAQFLQHCCICACYGSPGQERGIASGLKVEDG